MQIQTIYLEAVLLDNDSLSIEQLAMLCSVETGWIIRHIEDGLLQPLPHSEQLCFSSADLQRIRRMRALERDFDAVPELAALVADLQEEIDLLRRKLRRAGLE